ncbi:MAG TPA: hypothetical protein VK558_07855 [Patescibacteria group bacterium]|nr:hypothetical protein [Patescibacteria group bacterium]
MGTTLLAIVWFALFLVGVFALSGGAVRSRKHKEVGKQPAQSDHTTNDQEDEWLRDRAEFRATPSTPFDIIITYSGGSSPGSSRHITVNDIVIDQEGTIYWSAYCHKAKAPRTFRGDNISALADAETGEIIDLREFLEKNCRLPLWSRQIRVKMTEMRKRRPTFLDKKIGAYK